MTTLPMGQDQDGVHGAEAVDAVRQLAKAIARLRELGVFRSKRYTGDLGEWFVEVLYGVSRAPCQTEKAWDVMLPPSERTQVKTQSFDPENRWNYLESDLELFDRLIAVLITDNLTIRGLYSIPSRDLRSILRTGKEKKPIYNWDDLKPWRVDPRALPGYARIAELVEEPK